MSETKPAASETVSLTAAVTAVTLFEDRAQVEREGRIELEAGRVRLRVDGVSPVMADKTLAASLPGADPSIRLVGARVRRSTTALPENRPPDVASLEERIRALEEETADLRRRRTLLEDELAWIAGSAEQLVYEASVDASWGLERAGVWRDTLHAAAGREAALHGERLEIEEEIRRREEAHNDLLAQKENLSGLQPDFCAWAEIDLILERAAPVTLQLKYLVPSACWRPAHRATLRRGEGGAKLLFETDACVWQNTGEPWTEARFVFSTQRPSLGTEPPPLDEDVLRVQDRPDQVAVEAREETIQTTGLGAGARKQAEEMPGIDDAGEALFLESRHRATVPPDGRPYRVAIGAFETEAEETLAAFPEKMAAAVRRCVAPNASRNPVLAGPVDVVADSGYVGSTSILFTAPGEKFELGFGPDPELRVHRRADAVEHEKSMLGRWIKTDRTVELRLSNIGAARKRFEVTERIPVSEVEQVRIELDRKGTRPPATPDRDGFVKWTVTLGPGERETLQLRYAVEKKAGVVGI